MRLVTLPFASSADFLSSYSEAYPGGALHCRTKADLRDGEVVLVEISFPGLPNRVLVRGIVVDSIADEGAWLRFHEADVTTRDFLLGVARGHIQVTPTTERSFERFPAAVPVDCRIERDGREDHLVTQTADLGAGGAFIESAAPPPVGTRVTLSIAPAGSGLEPLTVEGEVVWVRNDADARGFAVRFQDPRNADNRRLRATLRHASERGRLSLT